MKTKLKLLAFISYIVVIIHNNTFIIDYQQKIHQQENEQNSLKTFCPSVKKKQNEKKLFLYYNTKTNKYVGSVIENDWGFINKKWEIWHTFNLHSTNPVKYKKIKILGASNYFYSKVSWGNVPYYGKKLSDFNNSANNNEINQKMLNQKIIDANRDIPNFIPEKNRFLVQKLSTNWGKAYLDAIQWFILTWYYENNNYYIQVSFSYSVDLWNSYIFGGVWMGIGTGIELYVDKY